MEIFIGESQPTLFSGQLGCFLCRTSVVRVAGGCEESVFVYFLSGSHRGSLRFGCRVARRISKVEVSFVVGVKEMI